MFSIFYTDLYWNIVHYKAKYKTANVLLIYWSPLSSLSEYIISTDDTSSLYQTLQSSLLLIVLPVMSFHIFISQIEKWQCKNLKWERSCDTEITLKIFRWSHPLFKSVSFRWFFSPSIQNLVGVNRVQEIFNLKENRFKEFLFWLIVHQLQIYLHANYCPSRMENKEVMAVLVGEGRQIGLIKNLVMWGRVKSFVSLRSTCTHNLYLFGWKINKFRLFYGRGEDRVKEYIVEGDGIGLRNILLGDGH